MSKTQVQVYTDQDGHLHYDFIIDKEHMSSIKGQPVWTKVEVKAWEFIQSLPEDDFFKKAFSFSILLRLLHNHTHNITGEVSPASPEAGE